MPPVVKHLTIEQGETWDEDYELTQTVEGVEGPLDLTGRTLVGWIAADPGSAKLAEFRFTRTDDVGGKFRMTLEAEDSEAMGAGEYWYDVELQWTSGGVRKVRKLLKGRLTLNGEVTKNV